MLKYKARSISIVLPIIVLAGCVPAAVPTPAATATVFVAATPIPITAPSATAVPSPVPPTAAPATAINLSQDSIKLGIATQNLAPNNPQFDARPVFQAGVQYAQSHHIPTITVDRGNYYFLTSQTPVAYLNLNKVSDLTIDLAGSTIYFRRAFLEGFAVVQSQRVTLMNFQTDFVEPPYSHVALTSIDANARKLTYNTLPNWVDPSTFSGVTTPFGKPELWAVVFRDGSMVPGTSRMPIKDPIGGGVLELGPDSAPWNQPATLSTLKAGDIAVVMQRVGLQPLYANLSDSITLSNISVYGSSNWAVSLDNMSNSIVDHVKVMPRPGTGLVGSNGDGIHFHYARQNNIIRNSSVRRTVDDGISIDSIAIATVMRQVGPRQIHAKRTVFERFPNGTRLNLLDPVTLQEAPGAAIVSQDPPDSDSPTLNGEVDLTFDQDLPSLSAGTYLVFGTPEMRGAGSRIEDNSVEDMLLGRGIWISGSQGVTVQRNSVGHTSNGGIVVSHDTREGTGQFQGPPAHDIVIQNNSVVGSLGPMASGSGTQTALASIIVISLDNKSGFGPLASNTNITIRNNYVADSGRSGIWLGNLAGGSVQNNVVIRWNRHPELPYNGISAQTQTQIVNDASQPIVSRIATNNLNATNNTTDLASNLTGPVALDRSSISLPSQASNPAGSIALQPNIPNFEWLAVSDSPWLTVKSSGAGAGSIQFVVSENTTGAQRVGTITVGGVNFTVTQAAAGARP